jgi:creatinine amidohydrolase
MRFDDVNWMDVESYLQCEDRVMLVLGACEEHGYLSLTTDVRIPLALADAASQQTGVLVAPPVSFGLSPYFAAYPGTISLRARTYLLLFEDILRELHRQGFRRILVLNGHGGNAPVTAALEELLAQLPGVRIGWYSWFDAPHVQAVAEQHGLHLGHANWSEAFSFTQVAVGHNNDQIVWAGHAGSSAVEADFPAACFPFDGIGYAGAVDFTFQHDPH